MIAGGSYTRSVDFLTEDLTTKPLLWMPARIDCPSMIMHNGTILLCGGSNNIQKCLQFYQGTWKWHSTLNEPRWGHSAVTTQKAAFIFGGYEYDSRTTYEYLPKNSTTWVTGKNSIPRGFSNGCAISVKSEQEIWLIGGFSTEKRILSFNVNDHTFRELPFQLNVGRVALRSSLIPNTNKVMVTGGNTMNGNLEILESTEIIDTEDGSVTIANPMNCKRCSHGIGIVTIKGENKLVVFGGYGKERTSLNGGELYNTQTEKWETVDIKMREAKYSFGFLSFKLGDVIKNIKDFHRKRSPNYIYK